jgi:hypothetical protein
MLRSLLKAVPALSGLALGASAVPARAQDHGGAPPSGAAARASVPPTIDGRLDDPAWQAAPPVARFVQHEPFEGRPITERTEVRLLYDRDAIYVGAWLYDSDPQGLVRGETRRDAGVDDTDAFLIVLDTYHDRQNGFVFGTTPAGIEYDGQVTREGTGSGNQSARSQPGAAAGFNLNWDGSWTVATSADQHGWYAEFRIPFSTLRYPRGGAQVWGMNLARYIRRKSEQGFWSRVGREYTLWRISAAGTLTGVEAPTERSAHLTPYVLGSLSRDYTVPAALDTARHHGEVGGDAKLVLAPSLTLDLTYNTDFAQVEVDEQQVNLTRFNLFFPEKRPFFLENAGMFSVGTLNAQGSGQAAELFFSRRIGIGPDSLPVPVPIVGGGRLTGKVAGTTVGLLDIQTEEVPGIVPANNFGVARLMRELPNRSRLGAMVINRWAEGSTGNWNRTYVADGRLGIGSSYAIDAFAARTATPGASSDNAFNLSGTYTTRDWSQTLTFTQVGDAFDPQVGFLERSGYRFYQVSLLRHVRFAHAPWLRELRPHATVRGWFGFDGYNQSGQVHLDNHIQLANGAFFSPAVNFTREGLQQPFAITDSITVAPGRYDHVELAWRWNTNLSAPISLDGGIDWGGFYSGRRHDVFGTLSARKGATLAAQLKVSHNDVTLAEGAFQTTLIGLRVAYAFTPRIYLQSLIQYNSQAASWSGNIRFGWLNTAGTGLFVVYNDARQSEDLLGPLSPQSRAFIVKFTRQFNVIH